MRLLPANRRAIAPQHARSIAISRGCLGLCQWKIYSRECTFSGQAYGHSRCCFLWEPLALVQERLERVVFERVRFLDMASKRLPVFVSLILAVRTSSHTTSIFNTVAEPLPAVYVYIATSSSSDVDQLPRRIGYLLLALCGIKIILGRGLDQLEGFAAFFTFPCVELHLTNTMFHIETKVLGERPCSI